MSSEARRERLGRIKSSCVTQGARACVEQAEELIAKRGSLKEWQSREARQWVALAVKVDKAAADEHISELAAQLDNKGSRGKRLDKLERGNVVPLAK